MSDQHRAAVAQQPHRLGGRSRPFEPMPALASGHHIEAGVRYPCALRKAFDVVEFDTCFAVQFSSLLEHTRRRIQPRYATALQGKTACERACAGTQIKQPLPGHADTVWCDARKQVRWKTCPVYAVVRSCAAKVYVVHQSPLRYRNCTSRRVAI